MVVKMNLSPAESYARVKLNNKYLKTKEFSESFPFELDDFQISACHALESGKGVLVAAPTGAGKTIVGEFAVNLVINSGGKCFYTTPIKALSNQKFSELSDKYGSTRVGLLTGDTSINSEAQIVVMTTEVLRNMIYANSTTITDLKYVVMDEVHYLADKFRGAVWEEILIHLSDAVQVISLSATVSNAEEFGEWLQTVRGDTEVIVSETRPVPLYQHVLFGNRLIDLFGEGQRLNPELTKLERDTYRKIKGNWRDKPRGPRSLTRPEVIEKLERESLLPAITFIFSRNNCDAAVRQCIASGIRLTNSKERQEIRDVVSRNIKSLAEEDLVVWNGEGHVAISPGEYTQLTGRAGRRGIDIEGNAVILWGNELDSTSVGGLASTRTYPLKSSFKPTYNMSINLISQFGSERARTSLESSLAQFQADKAVVGLSRQIRKNESARDALFNEAKCDKGDFIEYTKLRFEIKNLENDSKRNKRKRLEIEDEIGNIRKRLKNHSCHNCPDREHHSRITERAFRLQREIDGLTDRINSRTNVIAKRFDRIRLVLDKLGYLENDQITKPGRMLAKIYGETDLLIAESIRAGVFDQLTVPELVSVISACIYESRNDDASKIPRGQVPNALSDISRIYGRIHDIEIDMNLEPMRSPDFGFCWAAYRWASGNSLTSVLKGSELTVGDFVRSMKQIIDLLRQLRVAAPQLQHTIDLSLESVDRGVIAYAGAAI